MACRGLRLYPYTATCPFFRIVADSTHCSDGSCGTVCAWVQYWSPRVTTDPRRPVSLNLARGPLWENCCKSRLQIVHRSGCEVPQVGVDLPKPRRQVANCGTTERYGCVGARKASGDMLHHNMAWLCRGTQRKVVKYCGLAQRVKSWQRRGHRN